MARRHVRFAMVAGACILVVGGTACQPASRPAGPQGATASASTSCADGPEDKVTARILERTNSDRAANGVAPLAWDGTLYCLARGWSAHMAATGAFAHSDLATTIKTSPYDRYATLGENIAHGGRTLSGDQLQNAWMNSPGHRANILSGAYTSVAVALAPASDGTVYVTVNFGR